MERRGGSRQTEQQRETIESIVAFLKRQKVVGSHYSAAKTSRQYLSHELNLAKLYRMWVAERQVANLPVSKNTTFKDVFYERFNLGFGTPKSDVCSTCKTLTGKCKEGPEEDRKEEEVRLKLHELRWKKFYQILNASRCDHNTLVIVFDLQQTMPIPKTNVSDAFYKRQIWLYNLGIVVHSNSRKQNKKNVFLYTWLESQGGRGSNIITSCLRDFLHRIKRRAVKRHYRRLHLVSDSCSGQNKNQSMLMCLLEYVNSKDMVFKDITYTFPIVGHSYLPPDRVFDRIEKELRKKEEIVSPDGYYSVLRRHGHLKVYPQQWSVRDYKTLASSTLRSISTMKIRDSRVWQLKKGSSVIHVAHTYSGDFKPHNLLKPNAMIRKPKLVRPQSFVSAVKMKDVRELLEKIHVDPTEAEFYNNIQVAKSIKDDLRHPTMIK